MATLTASLERSLQNCSLKHRSTTRRQAVGGSSNAADSGSHHYLPSLISTDLSSSTVVELNSHISLPYYWEQCLDLKTGEIYYINWRSGKKAKEDPRLLTTSEGYSSYSSEEEDDENDDEDQDSYDSEGGSSGIEYSSASSMENYRVRVVGKTQSNSKSQSHPDGVLVVAGCKTCLMYYMVPKHVQDCPKCTTAGQLIHFDPSHENS